MLAPGRPRRPVQRSVLPFPLRPGWEGQLKAKRHPAEKERRGEDNIMQDKDQNLSAVPGYTEGIKWQPVGQQIGNQNTDACCHRQLAQTLFWSSHLERGKYRQSRATRAKAKQCNADNHECEVVELSHREQACQVDLKGQCGG